MGNTSVKITGDAELKRKLAQLGTKARGALLDAAMAGGEVIEQAAEPKAPGPHIEIGHEKIDGGRASVEIGPDKEHWFYQFFETGASRHEIKGSPLVFEGERGLVITQKVDHPGIPAAPFLRPAMQSKKDAARDAAGRMFRRVIDKLVTK